MVENEFGVIVDFEVAVSMMDEDLREERHKELKAVTNGALLFTGIF